MLQRRARRHKTRTDRFGRQAHSSAGRRPSAAYVRDGCTQTALPARHSWLPRDCHPAASSGCTASRGSLILIPTRAAGSDVAKHQCVKRFGKELVSMPLHELIQRTAHDVFQRRIERFHEYALRPEPPPVVRAQHGEVQSLAAYRQKIDPPARRQISAQYRVEALYRHMYGPQDLVRSICQPPLHEALIERVESGLVKHVI